MGNRIGYGYPHVRVRKWTWWNTRHYWRYSVANIKKIIAQSTRIRTSGPYIIYSGFTIVNKSLFGVR